jgi:hypothetical protein
LYQTAPRAPSPSDFAAAFSAINAAEPTALTRPETADAPRAIKWAAPDSAERPVAFAVTFAPSPTLPVSLVVPIVILNIYHRRQRRHVTPEERRREDEDTRNDLQQW